MKQFTAKNIQESSIMAHVTNDEHLVIMSYNIHNPSPTEKVSFIIGLYQGSVLLANVLESIIDPKDTLFLDTKTVLLRGQHLKVQTELDLHIIISGA